MDRQFLSKQKQNHGEYDFVSVLIEMNTLKLIKITLKVQIIKLKNINKKAK